MHDKRPPQSLLRALALLIAVSALSAYVGMTGCTRRGKPDPMLPATKAAPMDLVPQPTQPAPAINAPAAPPTPPPMFLPATKAAPMHFDAPLQQQAPQQQAPQQGR